MPPLLRNVIRLDSTPINQTFFTSEGYLKDRPVLTSTGIFEYLNSDGTVRRELRLPEDVFEPHSLASYEGKPIIITHDAGMVTKDNVADVQIGTILTEGYRSGNDVRAKIIIHNTDEMKDCGLRELSLGYNLDLEEEPGEWNGERYDAIQRNIRINHLALVREARAGEQARLNIDSRDNNYLIGGRLMSKKRKNVKRADSVLSPEELSKAIEEYKTMRGQQEDTESDAVEEAVAVSEPEVVTEPERSEENSELEKAKMTIKDQDKDIKQLLDIVDTLLAESEFNSGESLQTDEDDTEEEEAESEPEAADVPAEVEPDVMDEAEETPAEGGPVDVGNIEEEVAEIKDHTDEVSEDMQRLFDIIDTLLAERDFEADEDEPTDDAEGEEPEAEAAVEAPETVEEENEDCGGRYNADSVDKIVEAKVKVGIIGRTLNLDGLEKMKLLDAKKAIIKAVRPGMRLDSKSPAFIEAAYDMAVEEAGKRTGVMYQRAQMFNKDGKATDMDGQSAKQARDAMIERQQHKNNK